MMRSETVRVHAALASVSLIYGYFYVVVKLLLKSLSPSEFILLRFVLTAIIVVLIDVCYNRDPLPPKKEWLKIAGLGLVGVFLVQILVTMGLHYTSAFHSTLIMATIPIITLLFSIICRMEPFRWLKLVGSAIAFAGVAVLLFLTQGHGTPLPDLYLAGDTIVLLNALAFSWFLLGSQAMLKKVKAFPFMAYGYIVSAVLFTVLFVGLHWFEQGNTGLAFVFRLNWLQWLMIGYVVIFGSIGTYTLNNYALKRVSPSMVAVYMFIQPVISAMGGYYWLGESFNLTMGLATLLTFGGMLIASSTSPAPPEVPDSVLEEMPPKDPVGRP